MAEAPATRLVDTRGTELLSKREQDVVRWLAEGHTNNEIAGELQISENTVKNYLFRIFDKLGVSCRVEVVLYAPNQSSSVQWMTSGADQITCSGDISMERSIGS